MQDVHIFDLLAAVTTGTAGDKMLSVIGCIGKEGTVCTVMGFDRLRKGIESFRFKRNRVECLLRFRAECVGGIVVFKRVNTDDVILVGLNEFNRLFNDFMYIFQFVVFHVSAFEDMYKSGVGHTQDHRL